MLQCLGQCGARVILPLVFKAGRNTDTIAIPLREVHYRMVIVCNICQSFTGMNAQSILDHCSTCKAKCDKKHVEQKGHKEVKKSHKREVQVLGMKGGILVTQIRCHH